MKRRILNSLDALSQLVNCLIFPNAEGTNANESISGRSYRLGVLEGHSGWGRLKRLIDALFRGPHCKDSYQSDVSRAAKLLSDHRRYSND
jgi:hypothetical protein